MRSVIYAIRQFLIRLVLLFSFFLIISGFRVGQT